jgi:hypothetical protein
LSQLLVRGVRGDNVGSHVRVFGKNLLARQATRG